MPQITSAVVFAYATQRRSDSTSCATLKSGCVWATTEHSCLYVQETFSDYFSLVYCREGVRQRARRGRGERQQYQLSLFNPLDDDDVAGNRWMFNAYLRLFYCRLAPHLAHSTSFYERNSSAGN